MNSASQNNRREPNSDSSEGAGVNIAKDLLSRAGLPDKNSTRGVVAMCLLAEPETMEFDYEAYREDPSEYGSFTNAARPSEIQKGDTLSLEEMRNWRGWRISSLLEWWSIGIGTLYEVRDSVGMAVYALQLVSGGGYEYQEWYFGPWPTLESAQQDLTQRGAFIGWFPGNAIPYEAEKIVESEAEASVWNAYEPHPRPYEPVGLFPVFIDGKTGFIDSVGRLMIPPRFAGWGYNMWTPLIGPLGAFDEGLAPVWIGDRTGYIDRDGRVSVPPVFVRTTPFSEGLAAVQIGSIDTDERLARSGEHYLETWTSVPAGRWGYIDRKGGITTPFRFDFARPFRDGLGLVQDRGKWGYIDRFGNVFLRPQWDDAGPFCHGLAAVMREGAWGFIGRDGQYAVPPEFTKLKDFSFDLSAACDGRRWGYIDSTGRMRIDARFDDAATFSEGLAAIKYEGMTGFIDRFGRFVIPPELDEAWSFSEGLAPARAKGIWGYISASGQWSIEPRFDKANNFRHGLAAVQQSGNWGYVNSTGDFVWDPTS